MKTLQLLFVFLFISAGSFAQYSGTFFESLGPYFNLEYSDGYQMFKNTCFGIPLSNGGGLGVRFADSLDTEVQWVKLDAQGNPTFYSSNLPGDSVNRKERILNVFDDGTNQFIVTSIKMLPANNPLNGIYIYKFTNYTNFEDHLFIERQLNNSYYSSYFEFGNIYLFLDGNRAIVDGGNLTLSLHEGISNQTTANNMNTPESFVQFIDENRMNYYFAENNVFTIIEIDGYQLTYYHHSITGNKLIGIDFAENKIKLVNGISVQNLLTYDFNFDDFTSLPTLNFDLQLPSTIGSNYFSRNNVAYQKNGNKEYLANFSDGRIYEIENNILVDSIDLKTSFINNFQIQNGFLFLSGMRDVLFTNYASNYMAGLFLKLNFLEDFIKDKSYNQQVQFGDRLITSNVGQMILQGYLNNETSFFDPYIFNLSQHYVGKVNGELKGYLHSSYRSVYKPGPKTSSSYYDQEMIYKYNQLFYIDLNIVNAHVAAFNSGSTTYQIPKSILNWPAHGDVSKGQAANLAPFIDVNDNGIYEPTLGDYPAFPGTHCLLNISHQLESDFENQGSGLELHTYLYDFDCNDSINDAVFIKTEVYNRSSFHYDSIAAGLFADFDIGNPWSDYVGTHVNNGMIYAYNATEIDDSFQGNPGLGESLASCGVLFLKGSPLEGNNLDDSPGVGNFQTVNGFGYNDGIIDNEFKGLEFSNYYVSSAPAMRADPQSSSNFFNTLTGKWTLGDAKTYGGNGLDPLNDSIFSRYSYPDDSDPMHYGTYGVDPGFAWSEVSNGNPTNMDKRMIGSFGSTPLAPGQQITYHSAVLISKRIPGFLVSNQDLFAKAGHIRRVFAANQTDCGQTFGNLTEEMITGLAPAPELLNMNIYPNPFTDIIQIEAADFGGEVLVQIFDLQGKEVFRSSEKTSLFSLNLASQDAGMYLLQLSNEKGKSIGKIQKVK